MEALDGLVRRGPRASRSWRQSGREILLARYWQRYCGKNDTIGFFGPVCWVRLSDEGPAVVARAGDGLTRTRAVDLEWRPVAALAARLSTDPRLRPHLPVGRPPHLTIHSGQIWRPGAPPVPLTPPAAALLAYCDGTRTAAEVCRLAVAEVGSGLRKEADAALHLDQLVDQGLVRRGFPVPVPPSAPPMTCGPRWRPCPTSRPATRRWRCWTG